MTIEKTLIRDLEKRNDVLLLQP